MDRVSRIPVKSIYMNPCPLSRSFLRSLHHRQIRRIGAPAHLGAQIADAQPARKLLARVLLFARRRNFETISKNPIRRCHKHRKLVGAERGDVYLAVAIKITHQQVVNRLVGIAR